MDSFDGHIRSELEKNASLAAVNEHRRHLKTFSIQGSVATAMCGKYVLRALLLCCALLFCVLMHMCVCFNSSLCDFSSVIFLMRDPFFIACVLFFVRYSSSCFSEA